MQLYLVHCGFYDEALSNGIYEHHINFFVAAADFEFARLAAKALPQFQERRMHVDGIQEIQSASGFRVKLEADSNLKGQTSVIAFKHRDLAPASKLIEKKI